MALHYVKGTSYFTSICEPNRQYPYLTKDIETEVIIVGGGVTGCILGYYFQKENIPSVLVERKRIAHGSTSITTALLQYELDSPASELMPYTTKDNILRSYALSKKALDLLEEFIKEYGNESRYMKRDCLLYSNKKLDVPILEEEFKMRKDAGYQVEFLTKESNPFAFELEAGILSIQGGAEVDPYQYSQQLLKVATEKGLRVYENTPVTNVVYLEDGVIVETEYGHKIKGKIVVLATGYDTDAFTTRQFGTKSVSYNAVTNPVADLSQWYHQTLIRDFSDPYNYYRTTFDNRIIGGGQDLPFEQNINNVEQAEKAFNNILINIHRIFPNQTDLKLEYKYCGCFASTKDNMGFIGKDTEHENLWLCMGYGANGLLFALLGADMLSRLYKGEVDEDMKLFKVDRFDS